MSDSTSFDCLFCLKKTSSLKNQLTADVLKDLELFQFFCKYLFRLENPYNNNYDSDNSLRFNFDSIEGRMLPVCTKCANLYRQMVEFYSEFQELETQIKNVVEEFRQCVFSSESDQKHQDGFNTSDFHRSFRQHVLQRGYRNYADIDIKEEAMAPDESEIETADMMAMTMDPDYKIDPLGADHFDPENSDDYQTYDGDYGPLDQDEEEFAHRYPKVELETFTIEPRTLRSREIPELIKRKGPKNPRSKQGKSDANKSGSTSSSVNSTDSMDSISTSQTNKKKRRGKKKPPPKYKRVGRTVPPKQDYICPLASCRKQLDENKFRKHTKRHEYTTPDEEKTLTCPVCQKKFAIERNLNYHVRLHKMQEEKNKEMFICKDCDVCCQSQETLDTHIQAYHQRDVVKFVCTTCGKQFKSQVGFTVHLKVHAGVAPKAQKCKYCDESFVQHFKIRRHVYQKHPEHAEVFPCTMCDMKFYLHAQLRGHLKSHSAEKTLQCKLCDEKFRSRTGLDSHQVRSHGKEPYSCSLCENKTFISNNALRDHNRIHHNKDKFQFHTCPTCDKKFTSRHLLGKHLTVHTDERNHICEECGKAFKTSDTLFNHKRSHAGGRRFKCEICDRVFTWSQSFSNHMKSHHGIEKTKNAKATVIAPATATTPSSSAEDLSMSSVATNSAVGSSNQQLYSNLLSEMHSQSNNIYPFPNNYHQY